jgi:hypothetical protein
LSEAGQDGRVAMEILLGVAQFVLAAPDGRFARAFARCASMASELAARGRPCALVGFNRLVVGAHAWLGIVRPNEPFIAAEFVRSRRAPSLGHARPPFGSLPSYEALDNAAQCGEHILVFELSNARAAAIAAALERDLSEVFSCGYDVWGFTCMDYVLLRLSDEQQATSRWPVAGTFPVDGQPFYVRDMEKNLWRFDPAPGRPQRGCTARRTGAASSAPPPASRRRARARRARR